MFLFPSPRIQCDTREQLDRQPIEPRCWPRCRSAAAMVGALPPNSRLQDVGARHRAEQKSGQKSQKSTRVLSAL